MVKQTDLTGGAPDNNYFADSVTSIETRDIKYHVVEIEISGKKEDKGNGLRREMVIVLSVPDFLFKDSRSFEDLLTVCSYSYHPELVIEARFNEETMQYGVSEGHRWVFTDRGRVRTHTKQTSSCQSVMGGQLDSDTVKSIDDCVDALIDNDAWENPVSKVLGNGCLLDYIKSGLQSQKVPKGFTGVWRPTCGNLGRKRYWSDRRKAKAAE